MFTATNTATMPEAPSVDQLQKITDYKRKHGERFEGADFSEGILQIHYGIENGLRFTAFFDEAGNNFKNSIKTAE